MAWNIDGWLEINETGDSDAWMVLVELDENLDAGLDREYGILSSFFGVKAKESEKAIAANRGLPENVSTEIRKHSDSCAGSVHGHTWINYQEIVDSDCQTDSLCDSWKTILACMARLAEEYGNENVRMVIWFYN